MVIQITLRVRVAIEQGAPHVGLGNLKQNVLVGQRVGELLAEEIESLDAVRL